MQHKPATIPDGEVLRRGILLRDLYRDPQRQQIRIARQAFLLRPQDQGELSVFRAALESPEKTFERLQRSEALGELITEDVRQLELEVEPRPEPPDNLAHAAILGLPTPSRDDPGAPETIAALRLAQELVILCDPAACWFRTQPSDDLIDLLTRRGQVAPET